MFNYKMSCKQNSEKTPLKSFKAASSAMNVGNKKFFAPDGCKSKDQNQDACTSHWGYDDGDYMGGYDHDLSSDNQAAKDLANNEYDGQYRQCKWYTNQKWSFPFSMWKDNVNMCVATGPDTKWQNDTTTFTMPPGESTYATGGGIPYVFPGEDNRNLCTWEVHKPGFTSQKRPYNSVTVLNPGPQTVTGEEDATYKCVVAHPSGCSKITDPQECATAWFIEGNKGKPCFWNGTETNGKCTYPGGPMNWNIKNCPLVPCDCFEDTKPLEKKSDFTSYADQLNVLSSGNEDLSDTSRFIKYKHVKGTLGDHSKVNNDTDVTNWSSQQGGDNAANYLENNAKNMCSKCIPLPYSNDAYILYGPKQEDVYSSLEDCLKQGGDIECDFSRDGLGKTQLETEGCCKAITSEASSPDHLTCSQLEEGDCTDSDICRWDAGCILSGAESGCCSTKNGSNDGNVKCYTNENDCKQNGGVWFPYCPFERNFKANIVNSADCHTKLNARFQCNPQNLYGERIYDCWAYGDCEDCLPDTLLNPKRTSYATKQQCRNAVATDADPMAGQCNVAPKKWACRFNNVNGVKDCQEVEYEPVGNKLPDDYFWTDKICRNRSEGQCKTKWEWGCEYVQYGNDEGNRDCIPVEASSNTYPTEEECRQNNQLCAVRPYPENTLFKCTNSPNSPWRKQCLPCDDCKIGDLGVHTSEKECTEASYDCSGCPQVDGCGDWRLQCHKGQFKNINGQPLECPEPEQGWTVCQNAGCFPETFLSEIIKNS